MITGIITFQLSVEHHLLLPPLSSSLPNSLFLSLVIWLVAMISYWPGNIRNTNPVFIFVKSNDLNLLVKVWIL